MFMKSDSFFVNTNIRITKTQREFLKQSPYSLSALVRKTLNDLIINEAKTQ
jgi:hypothetical protein